METPNADQATFWSGEMADRWIAAEDGQRRCFAAATEALIEASAIAGSDRVLDIGCGFGETALEIAQIVGPAGEVVGIDCTDAFLEIANQERDAAGAINVRYEIGDAQVCDLPESYFDVVYSRFGVMFFQSAVRALRNANRTLKPGYASVRPAAGSPAPWRMPAR